MHFWNKIKKELPEQFLFFLWASTFRRGKYSSASKSNSVAKVWLCPTHFNPAQLFGLLYFSPCCLVPFTVVSPSITGKNSCHNPPVTVSGSSAVTSVSYKRVKSQLPKHYAHCGTRSLNFLSHPKVELRGSPQRQVIKKSRCWKRHTSLAQCLHIVHNSFASKTRQNDPSGVQSYESYISTSKRFLIVDCSTEFWDT